MDYFTDILTDILTDQIFGWLLLIWSF